MAEQALKKIPNKTLKEIHRLGTLECLLDTEEGQHFFNTYLNDVNNSHPEHAKYYNFYLDIVKLSESKSSLEEHLRVADSCFEKYIAIEASPDTRLTAILTRSTVKELKKALNTHRETNTSPKDLFKTLQQQSLEHLDQNIFRPHVIPLLRAEKENRISACNLN